MCVRRPATVTARVALPSGLRRRAGAASSSAFHGESMRTPRSCAPSDVQTDADAFFFCGGGDTNKGTALSRGIGQASQVGGRGSGRRVGVIVEANAKRSLGCTKGGTNRHRRRTSGFRVRKKTHNGRKVGGPRTARARASAYDARVHRSDATSASRGRATQVLKARMKKGRLSLAPASKHGTKPAGK